VMTGLELGRTHPRVLPHGQPTVTAHTELRGAPRTQLTGERGIKSLCTPGFHKHEGVARELPECRAPVGGTSTSLVADGEEDSRYVRSTLAIYDAHARLFAAAAVPSIHAGDARRDEVDGFHLELFANMFDFKLGLDARPAVATCGCSTFGEGSRSDSRTTSVDMPAGP
jgi:hypothetical protein